VLNTLEKLPVKPGTERPAKTVRITEVIIYQDPFEEYKKRLANKLARRSQLEQVQKNENVDNKPHDDMNWFGVKVGSEANGTTVSGGVGKYLNLKRPPSDAPTAATEDTKKKRKLGFGDFEGWQ